MLEARAMAAHWNKAVDISIREGDCFAIDLELTQKKEGEFIKPTCSIPWQAAQTLMDDLWQCGLRPTEGTGSAGALKATQSHLEDMRRLVFE